MNTKKFLIGGIVGGVIYFLLGYLFYGVLLSDFFAKHAGTATGVMKAMDQIVWWALILGNIMGGCLLSYVFAKAGVTSVGGGLATGFVIGLLTSASFDLVMYATSNTSTSTSMGADICTYAVMSAITGAIVGWVCGRIK